MNMGAQLVRSVASKTNDAAGDGTTTATVLTRALFEEGTKAVASGCNPMDVRRGMIRAVEVVIEEIKRLTKQIDSKEEIEQVATISANSDKEIGSLLANAISKVGKEGVITVTDGKGLENEIEIVEGMRFDQGYLSHHFVTDKKTQKCEMENVHILLHDKKISNVHSLIPILEQIAATRKKLLIIASDGVDSEVLATLVLNKMRGINVVAVKAPGYGDTRKAYLQDLAILTGGELISEEMGMNLEDTTMKQLGTAAKVTISADDTIMLGGGGDKEAINERCEMIREIISHSSSQYDIDRAQERLGKLSGGVAVLKVGGTSEVEVGEKKDRIEDALNATRAAVEEGIVPGGGVALLYASMALDNLEVDNFDQKVGVEAVKKACQVPCKTIANNAGCEGALVVQNLITGQNGQINKRIGFNAQIGEYVDMLESGIIDPTKVVRTALLDAVGVASLMTTTECMVVDIPNKDEGKGGMPPMPDMF